MRLPSRLRRARTVRPTGRPLTLEALEDRTLLAGNLFLTTEVPGAIDYHFMQYDQAGDLLSSQPIPPAPGSTEYPNPRGLSVSPDGSVNFYDGTFTPALATLAPDGQTWSFQTLAGWSTVNNVSYGEVAAYNNFVFASDMFTFNGGEPNGIVRFDLTGGDPVRFADGTDYIQVALGQDGLLYGLAGSRVDVFDPDALTPVRSFSLQGGPDSDIRSIAVDPNGQVLAASWGGYLAEYNPDGTYTGNSTRLLGQNGFGENLINVALDTDGQVAVGGRFGDVFLTDESLASVQTIATNQWNVFVTFDHYIGTAQGPSAALGGPAAVPFGASAGAGAPVAGLKDLAPANPLDAGVAALGSTAQLLTVNPAGAARVPLAPPAGVVGANPVVPVGQTATVTAVATDGGQSAADTSAQLSGSSTAVHALTADDTGALTVVQPAGGEKDAPALTNA
jgi:hypothetical protein